MPSLSSHSRRSNRVRLTLVELESRLTPSTYNITFSETFEASAVAGQKTQFNALANFQGVTSTAGFTATIHWGDGSKDSPADGEPVTITPDPRDPQYLFDINGTHTYPAGVSTTDEAWVQLTSPDGTQSWGGPEGPLTYVTTNVPQSPPPPPPGNGTPGNPFQIGASEDFVPGSNVTLTSGTEVQVDAGGGAPQEPGVDWNTWYKNWINQVDRNVFRKMTGAFAGVSDQLTVTVTYQVLKDGRVLILGSNANGRYPAGQSRSQFLRNLNIWMQDARNGLASQRAPLPSNTKLPSIIRTFTFSDNMGGPPVKLGGPPSEPTGGRR